MRGRSGRVAVGRGGSRRMPSAYPYPGRQLVGHIPFDLTLCEEAFPRINPVPDDKHFTETLVRRNHELTPAIQQQTSIQSLVSSVCSVIETLILVPANFEPAQIEEIRQVGSFKMGTMMVNSNVADVVVILRTLPTKEAVQALGNRLVSDLKASNLSEVPVLMVLGEGFEIVSSNSVVRCLIATVPCNMGKLMPDIHMDPGTLENNLAAVRHVRWFEENASHSSIKVMIRLLKDLRNRVDGFKVLSPWAIVLLAHHAVMNNPHRQPLPVNQAFRRCLQLLATGLLLPGSAGLADPCSSNGGGCYHLDVPHAALDRLCCAAQTLLRVLSYGGYRQILDTEGASGVATETSIWAGVVVLPSDPVCTTSDVETQGSSEQTDVQSELVQHVS